MTSSEHTLLGLLVLIQRNGSGSEQKPLNSEQEMDVLWKRKWKWMFCGKGQFGHRPMKHSH